jgi:hypothetical protein
MQIAAQYRVRLEHLFTEATRLTKADADQVKATAGTQGTLRSGGTLKKIVAAIELRAGQAVAEALASLDHRVMRQARCERLRGDLRERVRAHFAGPVRKLADATPYGAGAVQALQKLFDEAERRVLGAIDQHATGFVPSEPTSWVTAHPTLAFAINTLLAVGAIVVSVAALLK